MFLQQGICYDSANNVLYYIRTKDNENESVIIKYKLNVTKKNKKITKVSSVTRLDLIYIMRSDLKSII